MSDSLMLRLIDANLNRTREGLRVLEDIARLHLNDAELAAQLKAHRHRISTAAESFQGLLEARQAEEDVGAFLEHPEERQRPVPAALVQANAKRAQEALRVLEEISKLESETAVAVETFKEVRFALYTIEKELHFKLLRQQKRALLKGLYVILDPAQTQGRPVLEVGRAALEGGARVIQWRDKTSEKGQQLAVARRLQELCASSGALFVVNDHADLAIVCGADGLHVGQRDLPIGELRRILLPSMVIGCSTNNVEEARRAEADGADYAAVGSIFPTASKSDTRPASLESLRAVRAAVGIPVVAIGGIDRQNVQSVVEAGAEMAAVMSAVVGAPDVREAARALASAFEMIPAR